MVCDKANRRPAPTRASYTTSLTCPNKQPVSCLNSNLTCLHPVCMRACQTARNNLTHPGRVNLDDPWTTSLENSKNLHRLRQMLTTLAQLHACGGAATQQKNHGPRLIAHCSVKNGNTNHKSMETRADKYAHPLIPTHNYLAKPRNNRTVATPKQIRSQ